MKDMVSIGFVKDFLVLFIILFVLIYFENSRLPDIKTWIMIFVLSAIGSFILWFIDKK